MANELTALHNWRVATGDRLVQAAHALQAATETMPQGEYPVRHFFAPGVYMREMSIPSGHYVVGAVHKHEHLAILSQGTVRLSTEAGVQEFTAPATIHSYPGIKRICHALTDAVITTVHHNPTNTQDLAIITKEHVEATVETLLGGCENVQAINNAIGHQLRRSIT